MDIQDMRSHQLQLGLLPSLDDRLDRFMVVGLLRGQLEVIHWVLGILPRLLGAGTPMVGIARDLSRSISAQTRV